MTKATMRRGTPKASMDSMALGSAASLEEVAKAMVVGSATNERKRRRGTRKSSAEGRSTSKVKAMSATYNVRSSLPRLKRTPIPIWPTVNAIAAPTPMGAKYMTRLVNLNMTSASEENQLTMGARFSRERQASAAPKKMAKTATWRIWPSAIDFAMFSGKMWVRKSCQCVAAGAAMVSVEADEAERERPTPARLRLMAMRPMTRARVVATSK